MIIYTRDNKRGNFIKPVIFTCRPSSRLVNICGTSVMPYIISLCDTDLLATSFCSISSRLMFSSPVPVWVICTYQLVIDKHYIYIVIKVLGLVSRKPPLEGTSFSKGRSFLFLWKGHLKIQFHKASFISPFQRSSLKLKEGVKMR